MLSSRLLVAATLSAMCLSGLGLPGLGLPGWGLSTAQAQEQDQERAREAERRSQEGLLQKVVGDRLGTPVFDFGGWWRGAFERYTAPTPSKHATLRTHDVVVWARRPVGPSSNVYARVRAVQYDYNHGDVAENDDLDGPNLDLGYWEWDLAGHLESTRTRRFLLRVGRQDLHLGSGLLLDRVHDGVDLNTAVGACDLEVIVARSVGSQTDIDATRPRKQEESLRSFAGLELSKPLGQHRPYTVILYQQDGNRERPEDPVQEYDYRSRYFALGSRGVVRPTVGYRAELIAQRGRSFQRNTAVDPKPIEAFGAFLEAECRPASSPGARYFARAIWGSGDQDRPRPTGSGPTAGPGGNVDRGFVPFGYLPTGYVLAPLPANLRIFALGGAWKPSWGGTAQGTGHGNSGHGRNGRDYELGGVVYRYRKDRTVSGVSDSSANLPHADIGWAADAFLTWRIASDTFLNARWGMFKPGQAYSNRDDRQFVSLALIVSW